MRKSTPRDLGSSSWVCRGSFAWLIFAAVGCASTSKSGGAPAAPPPENAAEYYPLEAGWKWAYDVEKGHDHILAVYAVQTRTPDTAVVQAGPELISYAVMPDGIARRENEMIGDYI